MSSDDLIRQAEVAYAAGHLEAAFDAWELAHDAYLSDGDRIGAAGAAARIAMHLIIDTGFLAPVRRWIRHAERHLEGAGATPVDAPLALARAYERLFSGDFIEARQWSQRAIEAGGQHGDTSVVAMAQVAQARCHIFEGDVDTGLSMLEEASVAAAGADVDPLTMGLTYCEIVCAWQSIAMYDLAEQWTEEMERFSRRHAVGSVGGRCRIHRAEILRLRGECRDAEAEVLAACDDLRPYMRREYGWPLTELGTIRLRMGDLDGAEEAFLAAHEKGWEPQPGLSLLRLAQGDIAAASSLIRDALDRPLNLLSKELPPNNQLRRAPLLEAQVEIAIAAGDLDTGRAAADELREIATTFRSKALEAASSLAVGRLRLAEGNASDATRACRAAVHLWSEIAAPYEVALARVGLAQAFRAQGFKEGAQLELRAAQLAFERVGAKHQAKLAAAVSEADTTQRPLPVEGNRFHREGDFWTIAFGGTSTLVRDMKGLRYLQRLLSEPGREFHVIDLVALERGETEASRPFDGGELSYSTGGDAGELLDDRAKEVYRRRLAEIEEDIHEARAFGDSEREARAGAEHDFLVRELSRAVGMDGRDRRAGAVSERARASVTRALRNALKKIRDHHPDLGEHLDRTVGTGTYCAYVPDPLGKIEWRSAP